MCDHGVCVPLTAPYTENVVHGVQTLDLESRTLIWTPTMKLKRRRIVELYADRIDGMYESAST